MALNISIRTDEAAAVRTPLLVLLHCQGDDEPAGPAVGVDEALNGLLSRILGRGDFAGRSGQAVVVYPEDAAFPAERVLLVVPAPVLERYEAATPGRAIRRLGEVRYLDQGALRLRTIIWPDPEREVRRVLLVSNK